MSQTDHAVSMAKSKDSESSDNKNLDTAVDVDQFAVKNSKAAAAHEEVLPPHRKRKLFLASGCILGERQREG